MCHVCHRYAFVIIPRIASWALRRLSKGLTAASTGNTTSTPIFQEALKVFLEGLGLCPGTQLSSCAARDLLYTPVLLFCFSLYFLFMPLSVFSCMWFVLTRVCSGAHVPPPHDLCAGRGRACVCAARHHHPAVTLHGDALPALHHAVYMCMCMRVLTRVAVARQWTLRSFFLSWLIFSLASKQRWSPSLTRSSRHWQT